MKILKQFFYIGVLFIISTSLFAQVEFGIHPDYSIYDIRPASFIPVGGTGGADFLSDGRLVLANWGGPNKGDSGKMYILSGVHGLSSQGVTVELFATGFNEPLGVKIVNDEIYVIEKLRFSKVTDRNNDKVGEIETIAEGWANKTSTWTHALEYKDGDFYTTLNSWNFDNDPDHGSFIKMSLDGTIEKLAGGLRSSNATVLGPKGGFFTTDNQGNWLPTNKLIHLKPGRFYGFNKNIGNAFYGNEISPPTAWMPYGVFLSQSPSNPVLVKEGLFKDQFLIGDSRNANMHRVFLDEVNGEYQGAMVRFSDGIVGGLQSGINRLKFAENGHLFVFGVGNHGLGGANWRWDKGTNHGIQKLVHKGTTSFEVLATRSRENGIELEFTQPVNNTAIVANNYFVSSWTYVPTSGYGGLPQEVDTLSISRIQLSTDSRQVFLEIPGLRTGRLVQISADGIRSQGGDTLWGKDVYYTLNEQSNSQPFTSSSTPVQIKGFQNEFSVAYSPKGPIKFLSNSQKPVKVKVFDVKGNLLYSTGVFNTEFSWNPIYDVSGLLFIQFHSAESNKTVKFYIK